MDRKYRNKYRIPSARLQTWDYGSNAVYFVTICTHKRQHFFGKIINGKMHLSEFGKIVHTHWNEIPEHFPFIELGEFIAMPNHIHGIIIINKSGDAAESKMNPAENDFSIDNNSHPVQTPNVGVSSTHFDDDSNTLQTPNLGVSAAHPYDDQTPAANPNAAANQHSKKSKSGGKNKQWKPGTLGVILNQYKRICTINARKIDPNFEWQARFHDNVIRNDRAFYNISKYIKNNPAKWTDDTFNGQSGE